MKKSVLASLLALAIIFPGSVSMVFGQAASAAGQITIKDPAEYNDYTNAVGQSTPAAKAAAIEAFLTKYPNSVVKNDMLRTADACLPGRSGEDVGRRRPAAGGRSGESAGSRHRGLP